LHIAYYKEQTSHREPRGPQKREARSNRHICYYC